MENITLKDLVKGTTAVFNHYRNGYFYYNIECADNTYQLVLDQKEFQGVDLNREMKASLFMRWIRKSLENNTLTKV